jgi:hypothetical protein
MILVAVLAVLGVGVAIWLLAAVSGPDQVSGSTGAVAPGGGGGPSYSAGSGGSQRPSSPTVSGGPGAGPSGAAGRSGWAGQPILAAGIVHEGGSLGPASGDAASSAGAAGDSAADAGSVQALGWMYHGDYGVDQSGVQFAFGIIRAAGVPAIEAAGLVWNEPAGLDVTFEIPPGLSTPMVLEPDQIEGSGLAGLQTARLAVTFWDRSPDGNSTAHAGTIVLLLEGAGDAFGLSAVDESFAPETGLWSVDYTASVSEISRLAQASLTLDCPDLGIFQLVVSDWDSDHAELFQGSPLSIEMNGPTPPADLLARLD